MGDFVHYLIYSAVWLLVLQVFLVLSFSRTRPVVEGIYLVPIIILVGVAHLLWLAFLTCQTWLPGEVIFDWSFSPPLSALTFYISIALTLTCICILASIWRNNGLYKLRQKLFFSSAILLTILGVLWVGMIPLRVQSLLNHL